MTDQRRLFNQSERNALWLAADGRCAICGCELELGWHADHETPYAKGGATDVVNGQALCPPCNLKKATKAPGRYGWQDQALAEFLDSQGDFLAVATPGAGKTRFALRAIAHTGLSPLVIVPSVHLQTQWSRAAHDHAGLDLQPVTDGSFAGRTDGLVTTYQAVASNPDLYRHWTSHRPSIVIADEVHHCGENKTWGASVRRAGEPAARRLLLSGTPFRSDRTAIPFVDYDAQGECLPSYTYGYKEALRHGVVRRVEFHCWDGEAHWYAASARHSMLLSDAEGDERGLALRSALEPTSEWMQAVLLRAHDDLLWRRSQDPVAGGLVVVHRQSTALAVARMLRDMGATADVATSDDPTATATIERFAKGRTEWLVAVKMVSEGVDIPRLCVGVYATTTTTTMFFRQVVGRFVRCLDNGSELDNLGASIFIPDVPDLVAMARDIENEVRYVLDEEDREEREAREATAGQSLLFDVIPATAPMHTESILSGEDFENTELVRAEGAITQLGLGGGITPVQAAKLARLMQLPAVGQLTVPPPSTMSPTEERAELRALVSKRVRRIAYAQGIEQKDLWILVNDSAGEMRVKDASVKSLQARLTYLDEVFGVGS